MDYKIVENQPVFMVFDKTGPVLKIDWFSVQTEANTVAKGFLSLSPVYRSVFVSFTKPVLFWFFYPWFVVLQASVSAQLLAQHIIFLALPSEDEGS
jgi:hypothetical protein